MKTTNTIIVTGGCGFIGSALVSKLSKEQDVKVVVIDKITYAGTTESWKTNNDFRIDKSKVTLEKVDICDAYSIRRILFENAPKRIMHLAAESHVDRSIDAPMNFVQTNVVGTVTLLQEAYNYWTKLEDKENFKFQHISTDEVYGSLGADGKFVEDTPYSPHSPYSASKASSDHFVRVWHDTFGLPTLITNCSNNYGPYQFPEKLIPLTIINAIQGKELPIYGNGMNIRDWLYVDDHVKALILVGEKGEIGRTYNIGGRSEKTNIEIVKTICSVLNDIRPINGNYENQITFVKDRPGHDARYAIDDTRIRTELNWQPDHDFESGIYETVNWYLNNEWWWDLLRNNRYSGSRLGNL